MLGTRVEQRRELGARNRRDPSSELPQIDWQAWSDEIDARIKALDAKKQDKGDYLQPGDLNGYLRRASCRDSASWHADDVTAAARIAVVESRASIHAHRNASAVHGDRSANQRSQGFCRACRSASCSSGALGLSGPLAAAVIVAADSRGGESKSRVESRGAASADKSRSSTLDSTPRADRRR